MKADACDVRNGLRESVSGTWAGDEDLADGSLQQLFQEYKERYKFAKGIGSSPRIRIVCDDAKKILCQLDEDLVFLIDGKNTANVAYTKVLDKGTSSEQSKMEMAWNVIGFEELTKKLLKLKSELKSITSADSDINLLDVKSELLSYLKGLYSKKRVAATHILVFMIADELRNCKPYAVPVRFLPYKSLTDEKLRQLELELEDTMRANGMSVVGRYSVATVCCYFFEE